MLGMNFGRGRLKKTTQQMSFFHVVEEVGRKSPVL